MTDIDTNDKPIAAKSRFGIYDMIWACLCLSCLMGGFAWGNHVGNWKLEEYKKSIQIEKHHQAIRDRLT